MGLFDFFKKKENNDRKFTKDEAQDLLLASLDILCNDRSGIEDVHVFLKNKGLDDAQTKLVSDKAMHLYQTHFAKKQAKSGLFQKINRYAAYIVRFIGMQQQGNYAPIAAYENADGEITGFLYTVGDDDTYTLSAEAAIAHLTDRFEKKLVDGEIRSYVVLYHSQFSNGNNHEVAREDNELKSISVAYHFANEQPGKIGLPYIFENDKISYTGFVDFKEEENNSILGTRLETDKEYFQDRVEIQSPVHENEIGLKIKKSNNCDLGNTWGGVFGFTSYRKPNGSQALREHFALALTKSPIYAQIANPALGGNGTEVRQIDFENLAFKAIAVNGQAVTMLPVVKTDYAIEVENKEINEWENVHNTEALITGSGRDTFGLTYFATDYAENRSLYLSQKKLKMHISGIVFVLDIHTHDNSGEIKYSEDFTAYMPSSQLPRYACFDFIGQLEDYRETRILSDGSLKAYVLKVRLITHANIADFFTIDMYVTPENMRFTELVKGMKITGMVQMQGCVAG